MKILNAIHAQSIGGVDQMFRNYTSALTKMGHEVALLVSNNNNFNYNDVKKIFKLNNFSQIFDVFYLFLILIIFRPQIVICHSNRIMKWMKILGKITSVKSIAVNHGISFKSSLNCDYIININQQIHEMVVNSGFEAGKSFIIPNMIEVVQDYKKRELKESMVIGIYGRIEPRKGFDILIAAAKILQDKNHDFRLKIGGFEVVGSYNLQTIKNLAKDAGIYDRCDFVGVISDKEDFFKDVDIFVVPSREEPFGLVILEAFANSVLTISSDSVGGKILIEDEKDGLLFAREQPLSLAKKIIFVKENRQKYADFTKNAYDKLLKNYGFSAFCANLERFLMIFDKKDRVFY